MARTRISPLAGGLAAPAAVALAAACWVVFPPEVAGRALAARPDVDLPLPWPAEGQASAEVQGLGSLGSRGERQAVPIASVTKVMTAYVVLKDHPLGAGEAGAGVTLDEQAEAEAAAGEGGTAPGPARRPINRRDPLGPMRVPPR